MPETMASTKTPLTLIVAATTKNGIGKNGSLPWPMLKKEMAYFARVTKRVPSDNSTANSEPSTQKRNAVIMGRKTWLSIPPKFRPLKDRTNIIISTQPRSQLSDIIPEDRSDILVASNVPDALHVLATAVREGSVPELGRAYVIGGARVYEQVLGMEEVRRVLLTRVQGEWECDAFFPDLEAEGWGRKGREELEAFVGEEVREGGEVEGEVGFEFQLWERE